MLPAGAESPIIDVKTTLGEFRLKLYDDTPLHRDNFLKLVKEGYYDGMTFHRVIKDFMVQGGDPLSKDSIAGAPLGSGGPGYTIPAEIKYPAHYHKYGALAAARSNNPEKRSSGSQFYIVTGKKYPAEAIEERVRTSLVRSYVTERIRENLDSLKRLHLEGGDAASDAAIGKFVEEAEAAYTTLPAEILETYSTVGGTPHLDGEYTVFGEVVSGMDVVEKIQNEATDSSDCPVADVRILSMKVEKQAEDAVGKSGQRKKR